MINRMQHGGRRRAYARYISHYTRRNYALLGMGLLFLAGMLGGVLLVNVTDGTTLDMLGKLVQGFVEQRREQALLENFRSAAGASLIFVAVLFLCGFCAIAQPAEILLPAFRGLGFGFSVGYLYSVYGTTATLYIALFLMPDMLVTTIVILLCCRESIRLSRSFLSGLRPAKGEGDFYPLRLYVARYLVAALGCGASALVQAFICSAFANYVTLG
jgi:hypothetical protein